MSKEKPEVGDVWIIHGIKFYIEEVGSPLDEEYTYCFLKLNKNVEGFSIYTKGYIKKCGKYLGKSKVSIKELFDVAN